MASKTNVSWTHHTWNPWMGCPKKSPGCKNCYMYRQMRQYGMDPTKVVRSKTTFYDPLRWQKKAKALGHTEMVFTCSWSDWFNEEADDWRQEAWGIIRQCPNLIFQILTKLSERIRDHLPDDWGKGYPNVWLGVSIENNDYVWRADDLRNIPAAVRFVSYEPALGPLDRLDLKGIDWVICGGESGDDFRPMDLQWARDLRDRCQQAGIAFFFKQSPGLRSETGIKLDGKVIREFPAPRRMPLPVIGQTKEPVAHE